MPGVPQVTSADQGCSPHTDLGGCDLPDSLAGWWGMVEDELLLGLPTRQFHCPAQPDSAPSNGSPPGESKAGGVCVGGVCNPEGSGRAGNVKRAQGCLGEPCLVKQQELPISRPWLLGAGGCGSHPVIRCPGEAGFFNVEPCHLQKNKNQPAKQEEKPALARWSMYDRLHLGCSVTLLCAFWGLQTWFPLPLPGGHLSQRERVWQTQ